MKKKNKKKLPSFYYDELYKQNFYFHLGWNEKEFFDYASENYGRNGDSLDFTDGLCLSIENKDIGARGVVVWIRKKNDIPSLVHEATHAALFTLGERGFNLTFSESDETLPYLIEHIVRKALQ